MRKDDYYQMTAEEIWMCVKVIPFLFIILGCVGTIETTTDPCPYAWTMLFLSMGIILVAIYREERKKRRK